MSCVLIAGLESNIALAAVRSLGAREVRVIGISIGANALAASSKFLTRGYVLDWDSKNPGAFVDRVFSIAKSHGCDALMTPSETWMRLFNQHRQDAPGALNFCFPYSEVLERVMRKDMVLPIAKTIGIKVPATICVNDSEDLHRAADCVNFPVILKFSSVGSRPEGAMWHFKTRYVDSREELHRLADSYSPCGDALLVQEYAIGSYLGLGIARSKQGIKAIFQWTALREYEAGLGAFRVSMEPNRDIVEKSSELLAKVHYEGVAEVEYRLNKKTGEFTFMEVNPRLWGGTAFAVACGADFPWMSYCIATNRPMEQASRYRVGKYSRNLSGDLVWLYNAIRGRYIHEHPNIRYFPGQAMKDFVLSLGKRTTFDQESFGDIGPLIKSISNKIKAVLSAGK